MSGANAAGVRTGGGGTKKIMTQPIALMFKLYQDKKRVAVWLFENCESRIEGVILGFDEYMNVVLGDADLATLSDGTRQRLGAKIMLKGDNITLIQPLV